MPSMMPAPDTRDATAQALLTAGATVVCLAVAEVFGLEHANLAVWTTYLVMAQYTFTRFQKGLERVVGRGLGILAGLVLTTWFHDTPLLTLSLIAVLLTTFFYLYFAGRLAYTFLQAGLYVVAMFQIGHANPASAVAAAEELFAAIVLGVVVADLVTWLAGAEHDLGIRFGQAPLWPVRGDWLSQSLMLAVTVVLTILGAHMIDLPPEKAAISVMLLTVSPHLQALILKGELRIAGLLLAAVWSLAIFLVVGLLPHFLLLAGLLFLGQFVAAYLTQSAGNYAYAGLQMGLVLPMVVVAPRGEYGSLTPALQRREGILLGLVASVVVAGLWPRFPLADQAAPVPPPSSRERWMCDHDPQSAPEPTQNLHEKLGPDFQTMRDRKGRSPVMSYRRNDRCSTWPGKSATTATVRHPGMASAAFASVSVKLACAMQFISVQFHAVFVAESCTPIEKLRSAPCWHGGCVTPWRLENLPHRRPNPLEAFS